MNKMNAYIPMYPSTEIDDTGIQIYRDSHFIYGKCIYRDIIHSFIWCAFIYEHMFV